MTPENSKNIPTITPPSGGSAQTISPQQRPQPIIPISSEDQKRTINTTILLLFIVVFLLGVIIGYLMSGPQLSTAKIPFL